MTKKILTAVVTQVKIGVIEIEGLMDENQEFAVAIPQLVALNLVPPNRSIKQLESLLGITFSSHRKLKTTLNSKLVNVLGLSDVEKMLFKQAIAGNKSAIALCEAFIGLSLKQLFCDAFNIKFDEDDRQEYLVERMKHYKQFHPKLTRWLKKDAGGDSSKVNWGKEVNLFKNAASVPLKSVDLYNKEELSKLNEAEAVYNALRGVGINHKDALRQL